MRRLHPPAASVALIVVLGEIGRYRYAFSLSNDDSVLLNLAGAAYSNLTGKAPISLRGRLIGALFELSSP